MMYSREKLQNVTQMPSLKIHVHVPGNLTLEFQPLDINVNGVAKGFLKDKFQTWYTNEIQKQMDNGKGVYEVDVDIACHE